MTSEMIPRRIQQLFDLLAPTIHFFTQSPYARRVGDPTISDFALGNPHEPPLRGFAAVQPQPEPSSNEVIRVWNVT